MVQIDPFAVLGIGVMTLLFVVLGYVMFYFFKLYKLGKYKDLWKYWKYALFGFLFMGLGVAIAFYFYVLYIFSRPSLAMRVPTDLPHLILIYIGAGYAVVSTCIAAIAIREFYKNAEKMAKKEEK